MTSRKRHNGAAAAVDEARRPITCAGRSKGRPDIPVCRCSSGSRLQRDPTIELGAVNANWHYTSLQRNKELERGSSVKEIPCGGVLLATTPTSLLHERQEPRRPNDVQQQLQHVQPGQLFARHSLLEGRLPQ